MVVTLMSATFRFRSGKLAELMEARGLSQNQLGKRAGVDQKAISNWLAGRAVPSLEGAARLARFFAVPLDDLVEFEEPSPGDSSPSDPS